MAKKTTKRAPKPAADEAVDTDAGREYADNDDGRTIGPPPIVVPGAPRKPLATLGRSMLWLYGPQKIGKTTFASKFPGTWFFATEPGQDWVEVRQPTLIYSWEHFLDVCAFIEENKPMKFEDGEPIKWICIDTVDLLFRLCQTDVTQGLNIEDPGELGHGKAWSRLSNEFERVITKIRRWPFGLICLSHARDKMQLIRGSQRTRIEPDIGAAGMRTLSSAADLIMYMNSESVPLLDDKGNVTGQIEEKRVLAVRPTSSYVAGGRMSNRLPEKLDVDMDDPYGSLLEAIKKGKAE